MFSGQTLLFWVKSTNGGFYEALVMELGPSLRARTPSLTWARHGPQAIAGNLHEKTTLFFGLGSPLKEPRQHSVQNHVLNSSISLTATPFVAKKVLAFWGWGTRI